MKHIETASNEQVETAKRIVEEQAGLVPPANNQTAQEDVPCSCPGCFDF